MGGVTENSSTFHHHLNKAHKTIQSFRLIQFLARFGKLELSMAEKDTKYYTILLQAKYLLNTYTSRYSP